MPPVLALLAWARTSAASVRTTLPPQVQQAICLVVPLRPGGRRLAEPLREALEALLQAAVSLVPNPLLQLVCSVPRQPLSQLRQETCSAPTPVDLAQTLAPRARFLGTLPIKTSLPLASGWGPEVRRTRLALLGPRASALRTQELAQPAQLVVFLARLLQPPQPGAVFLVPEHRPHQLPEPLLSGPARAGPLALNPTLRVVFSANRSRQPAGSSARRPARTLARLRAGCSRTQLARLAALPRRRRAGFLATNLRQRQLQVASSAVAWANLLQRLGREPASLASANLHKYSSSHSRGKVCLAIASGRPRPSRHFSAQRLPPLVAVTSATLGLRRNKQVVCLAKVLPLPNLRQLVLAARS